MSIISTKYFGSQIPGLWQSSRQLAKQKALLTPFGFIRNDHVIRGTERTAGMLMATARIGNSIVEFDFTALRPAQIRELFRKTVRLDQTTELQSYQGEAKLVSVNQYRRKLPEPTGLAAYAKNFHEMPFVKQLIHTLFLATIPITLFFLGNVMERIQNLLNKTMVVVSSASLLLAGAWTTFLARFHNRTIETEIRINSARLLSDLTEYVKGALSVLRVLRQFDIIGDHQTIEEETNEILVKAKELLREPIKIPAEIKNEAKAAVNIFNSLDKLEAQEQLSPADQSIKEALWREMDKIRAKINGKYVIYELLTMVEQTTKIKGRISLYIRDANNYLRNHPIDKHNFADIVGALKDYASLMDNVIESFESFSKSLGWIKS